MIQGQANTAWFAEPRKPLGTPVQRPLARPGCSVPVQPSSPSSPSRRLSPAPSANAARHRSKTQDEADRDRHRSVTMLTAIIRVMVRRIAISECLQFVISLCDHRRKNASAVTRLLQQRTTSGHRWSFHCRYLCAHAQSASIFRQHCFILSLG